MSNKNQKNSPNPFDKFMNDLEKRQQVKKEQIINKRGYYTQETPQQKYNRLYRELPVNRIVTGNKNDKNWQ